MDKFMELFIPVLCSIFASTGMWTYLSLKSNKRDNKSSMLIGLGHDRIISLCKTYISRGYITADEYENLNDYLYIPYTNLGGNGSAKRLMEAVNQLEIRDS